jgi:hypothetical protein
MDSRAEEVVRILARSASDNGDERMIEAMVIHACSQRSSPVKNRMREICTSGSVGGEGGNILAYPALH